MGSEGPTTRMDEEEGNTLVSPRRGKKGEFGRGEMEELPKCGVCRDVTVAVRR